MWHLILRIDIFFKKLLVKLPTFPYLICLVYFSAWPTWSFSLADICREVIVPYCIKKILSFFLFLKKIFMLHLVGRNHLKTSLAIFKKNSALPSNHSSLEVIKDFTRGKKNSRWDGGAEKCNFIVIYQTCLVKYMTSKIYLWWWILENSCKFWITFSYSTCKKKCPVFFCVFFVCWNKKEVPLLMLMVRWLNLERPSLPLQKEKKTMNLVNI